MEDNVKKALLDGSATIQTKIEIVKENLLDTPYTENNKITKTAPNGDYYWNIGYSVPLEAGKTYTFSCKTTGSFGTSGSQTQCYLLYKYEYDYVIHVNNKNQFTFTPTQTGRYGIRCDINYKDETHSFWDFKVIEGEPIILTEKNSVVSWDYEDFRYVKDEGWIGQFVAKQVNGVVKNISDDFSMTDKEFVLHMGVKIGDNTTWYNLGNFLVNKVTDDEVNDKTSFEALDYTKKFNQTYVDSITYPCTALELAQNVCEQCGCELGNTDFKHNDWEIAGNVFTNGESCREVLKAIGKLAYSWVRIDWNNKVYIDFDSSIFRNQIDFNNINKMESYINPTNNLISAESAGKTIYIKCKQNTKYKINKVKSSRFTIGTTTHEPYYEILCNQVINDNNATELTITTKSDDNYLAVFYYTSYYDTLTEEEILNSLVIKEQPDEYNKINNSNYYSLTTQKEKIGAINRVVIGYKDIEGERTKVEDVGSIETNGVNEITVYDNPLVYNQELREKAIVGAEDLFGLEYLPLETLTVGHPWLKGNELVEVTDMEGKVHKTIPFDRTIQYFGHIKTKINVATNTKINTEYAYESGVGGRLRKTEIMVDKINGQIIEVIEEQDETTKKLNETISTVDETKQTISSVETTVENITTTTQISTGGNSLHITDSLESNALEYHVDGKSEQETSVQQDGDNIFDFQQWYEKISNGIMTPTYNRGAFTLNENGFSVGQPSGKDCWIQTSGLADGVSTGWGYTGNSDTEARKTVASYYTIPAEASNTYTLSCDITFEKALSGEEIKSELYIFAYDTDFNYLGLVSKGIYDTFEANVSKRVFINRTLPQNTKYIFWRVDNESYYTGTPCKMTVSNIAIKKGTDSTYTEFIPDSPSPDYPSKIKTIPSIRNLINPNEIISGGYSVGNGNYFSSETSFCTKYKIKIDNTKPYYLSHNVNNANQYYYVLYYDENENYLGHISSTITTKTMNLSTYSNYSKAKYINIRFDAPISYINEIQLEEGSIAHNYIPYGAWARVKITGKNLFDISKWKTVNTNLGRERINVDENTIYLNNVSGSDLYTTSGVTGGVGAVINPQYRQWLISVKPNTTYYLSFDVDGTKDNTIANHSGYYTLYDKNYKSTFFTNIARFTVPSKKVITKIKTGVDTKYIGMRFGTRAVSDIEVIYSNIQFEEEKEILDSTEYESYKEKEVLIDLNKPNLFDKDNANILNANMISNNVISSADTLRILYIKCDGNKSYTVEKIKSSRFAVGYTYEVPTIGSAVYNTIQNNNVTKLTISPNNQAQYLLVFYYNTANDTLTEQEILNSIKIYEGYTDYYELSSIGDIKDELSIMNGQVVIDKKIGKVVLDGSENFAKLDSGSNDDYIQINLEKAGITNINSSNNGSNVLSSHFPYYERCTMTGKTQAGIRLYGNKLFVFSIPTSIASNNTEFKTWLLENNATVYYELTEPQQIVLSNTQIPLYEGVNHITLVDDLETTTGIKFLRQTPISNEYATNQQLNETNYNLANTTSQSNENTANINATNTNLNNNYYTKPQIDIMNTATTEEITTIKKEVETKITAEDLNIAINKVQITGATSVTTTTGYTFNEDGLSIKKSGNEMSSTLDNDGLVVKRNETEVLTVRSSGVQTENLTVRTYFTIGDNTRAENYKGGTGFFYIGGDD